MGGNSMLDFIALTYTACLKGPSLCVEFKKS